MGALLDKFRASRPFVLNIGKRATVEGDRRAFMVTGWTGGEYELSCLADEELVLCHRPVREVHVIKDKTAACRYGSDGRRIPAGA